MDAPAHPVEEAARRVRDVHGGGQHRAGARVDEGRRQAEGLRVLAGTWCAPRCTRPGTRWASPVSRCCAHDVRGERVAAVHLRGQHHQRRAGDAGVGDAVRVDLNLRGVRHARQHARGRGVRAGQHVRRRGARAPRPASTREAGAAAAATAPPRRATTRRRVAAPGAGAGPACGPGGSSRPSPAAAGPCGRRGAPTRARPRARSRQRLPQRLRDQPGRVHRAKDSRRAPS